MSPSIFVKLHKFNRTTGAYTGAYTGVTTIVFGCGVERDRPPSNLNYRSVYGSVYENDYKRVVVGRTTKVERDGPPLNLNYGSVYGSV